MRTNGLVGSLALALAFANHGWADDEPAAPSTVEQAQHADNEEHAAGDEQKSASDQPVEFYDAADQPTSSQDLETRIFPEGWHECLIGSCSAYHLYAGTEFTAFNIHSKTGGVTTASFSDTTAPGVATIAFAERNGLDDWGYAPRVWLGAQITDKWGFRGRYWRLGDSDLHRPTLNPAIPTVGSNFATFEQSDTLDAWTADAEGVRSFEFGKWKGDMFVGGRHAEYASSSSFLGFGVFTTGNFINLTLQNRGQFEGSGVTYGGQLRRQVSKHVYMFGTARGSALDGHADALGRSDGTVASSPSAPLVGAATVTRNDADARMYIWELQAGVEFEFALQDLPANYFFRVAYEYQNWDIDCPPTGGAGFGGTIGELTTNSFASANASHAGMVLNGITIGTGLTW